MARKKDPEGAKAQILTAALQLFTEKGYEETTMQNIVDLSGMSRGAIYYHFKDKTEIYQSLYESLSRKPFAYFEEIEKDDIKFYTDAYDTKSKNKIHTVVYSAKDNTATVTLYNNTDLAGTDYKGGTIFYVEVDGSKASFKAAPATLADVDKFELVTTQVKAFESTPLEFKYYTNGIEITDAVKTSINATNLETGLVRDGVDAFVSSNSIYFILRLITLDILS